MVKSVTIIQDLLMVGNALWLVVIFTLLVFTPEETEEVR